MSSEKLRQKIRILSSGISDGVPLKEIMACYPIAEIDCDRATPDQLTVIEKILQLRPEEARLLLSVIGDKKDSVILQAILMIIKLRPHEVRLIAEYLKEREKRPRVVDPIVAL